MAGQGTGLLAGQVVVVVVLILDGVEKTNNVGVGWKVLMPRRDWLEPQEQKVPEIKTL